MKVRVCILNSSPARWMDVPLPELEKFSRPGLARATLIRSATELMPYFCACAGFTTSTLGTPATSVTGTKSFTWS